MEEVLKWSRIVHKDREGKLAVVAVLFEAGQTQDVFN